MKWIPKGSTFEQAEEPKAERSAAGLIEFVNQKTGHSKKLKGEAPPSFVTISPDVFKSSVKAEGKQAFIGFFAPWCGHVSTRFSPFKHLLFSQKYFQLSS